MTISQQAKEQVDLDQQEYSKEYEHSRVSVFTNN